jgi:type II secretory pathway pseudopilin PulG
MAYLGLLAALVIISTVAANTVQLGSVHAQRDQEAELLFVGGEFQRALQRYARATPSGLPSAPTKLEDLLRDPRHAGVVRHLRQIYPDPMAAGAEWVLMRDGRGLIEGVSSSSPLKPIRQSGPEWAVPRDGKAWQSYREWVFWRTGPLAGTGPARPAPLPAPDPNTGAR